MLKVANTYDGYNQFGITASVENEEDVFCLQEIFRSLVANTFGRDLNYGITFDADKKKAIEIAAIEYPLDTFFTLHWHNEKGSVRMILNPDKIKMIDPDMWNEGD